MKWLRSWGRCTRSALSKIHLVDKCLIIFMAVLLVQSVYSLFSEGDRGAETGSIDVVVRTSSASIFGYFLSANFIRQDKSKELNEPGNKKILPPEATHNATVDTVKNQIGFAEPAEASLEKTLEVGSGEGISQEKPSVEIASGRLQIVAAAGIGLFCLITLIVLRNLAQLEVNLQRVPSDSMAATVTQFRDFISGCVGFLIGCPTHSEADK